VPPFGSIDVHQHLWTPPFVEALRARTSPPRLDGWTLFTGGAAPHVADPADHDVARRTDLAGVDGLDLALVSMSAGLGVEWLPPEQARPLLDGYHEGVLGLPAPFGGWAATGLTEPDPAALESLLDNGFVGLELPATALLGEAGYAHCGPLLAVLERRGAPLLVHPGLAAPRLRPTAPAGVPDWWVPVVDYVQQLHAAWYAFKAVGRPRYPALRACFALLAGLGPLHGERVRARGGDDRGRVDPDAFVETSSYGPRAIDAVVRVLGVDVVVHGSDRPYAGPPVTGLGDAADAVVHRTNPLRLLHGAAPGSDACPREAMPTSRGGRR
jgi:hypothetical protein